MMNLSSDFMIILDEIRIAKKISVEYLCENIVSERTYYRMLKAKQIRTDVFSLLLARLRVQLSELIHFAVFVRKSDSRFKFIYRVHTKYTSDIAEHYQAIKNYIDPDEHLDLLLKINVKKYEYASNMIDQSTYKESLKNTIDLLQSNQTFSIYLFAIQLMILEEFDDQTWFDIEELAYKLEKEEFSYSVIMVAICYDMLLSYLLKSRRYTTPFKLLLKKYETFLQYFPSRFFLMRLNLYQAYVGMLTQDETQSQNSLFKYLMNARSILEEDEYRQSRELVSQIFQLDEDAFLAERTKQILLD